MLWVIVCYNHIFWHAITSVTKNLHLLSPGLSSHNLKLPGAFIIFPLLPPFLPPPSVWNTGSPGTDGALINTSFSISAPLVSWVTTATCCASNPSVCSIFSAPGVKLQSEKKNNNRNDVDHCIIVAVSGERGWNLSIQTEPDDEGSAGLVLFTLLTWLISLVFFHLHALIL